MSAKSWLQSFVNGEETNTFWLHLIGTADTESLVKATMAQIQWILDKWRENSSDIARNEKVTMEIIPEYESFECWESISTLTKSVRWKHVYLFSDPSGDYESKDLSVRKNDLDRKLMHDLLLLNSIRDNGARTVNLVQSCVPYARQDKTTPEKRQSASIDVIGWWIAGITERDGYCITMDIHNPASKSAFKWTNFINLYTGWFVEECMRDVWLTKDNTVLSGADQWWDKTIQAISKQFKLNNITVIKKRDYSIMNSVEEINIYGDVEWKDVFIHDDMLDTWGTMETLIRKMLKKKPKSINVGVTHWMLNGKAIERLTRIREESNWIVQNIYITDSINKENLPDFIKVIETKNILANTITGIYKWLWVDRWDIGDYTSIPKSSGKVIQFLKRQVRRIWKKLLDKAA